MIRGSRSQLWFSVVLVVVAAFLGFSNAFAETGEVKEDARDNALHPRSWSIQFQIDEGISLKQFDGMMISLKRHFTRRSALRVGIGLELSYDDSEEDRIYLIDNDLGYNYINTMSRNAQTIELDILYCYYPKPGAFVNLYVGGGPLVRYSRQKSDQETKRIEDAGDVHLDARMSYSGGWSGGVLGTIGVEWFLVKRFSFHAEYRASVAYRRTRSVLDRTSTNGSSSRVDWMEVTSSGWDFDALSVVLGLSVYF